MTRGRVRWHRRLAVLLACTALHVLLQTLWAHRTPPFLPAEGDFPPVLAAGTLSRKDYETLFFQTGLSPAAVDRLLAQGEAGISQIVDARQAFHAPGKVLCTALIPGLITCQDLLAQPGVPLAPLEPGDLLLTFSTHTEGWRHGHAGLVIDSETALEAAKPGEVSGRFPLSHWRRYSTLLILRVRNREAGEGRRAVQFALERLEGAPYSAFAGLGPAEEPDAGPLKVQCAYLPWRAWQSQGRDLDGDGGRLVTVADLAASPVLEVVQVFGMDPALFWGRAAGNT